MQDKVSGASKKKTSWDWDCGEKQAGEIDREGKREGEEARANIKAKEDERFSRKNRRPSTGRGGGEIGLDGERGARERGGDRKAV